MYIYIYKHTVNTSNTAQFTMFTSSNSICSRGHCIWDWYFSLTSSATKWVPGSYPDPPCCLFPSLHPQPASSSLLELDST